MKSLKKKLECKALTVYACYGKQQPDRLLCYVGKQAIICQNYKQKWTIFLHNWFLSKNRLQRICLLFSKQSILDDQGLISKGLEEKDNTCLTFLSYFPKNTQIEGKLLHRFTTTLVSANNLRISKDIKCCERFCSKEKCSLLQKRSLINCVFFGKMIPKNTQNLFMNYLW